jgi:hypothetical protein
MDYIGQHVSHYAGIVFAQGFVLFQAVRDKTNSNGSPSLVFPFSRQVLCPFFPCHAIHRLEFSKLGGRQFWAVFIIDNRMSFRFPEFRFYPSLLGPCSAFTVDVIIAIVTPPIVFIRYTG